MTIRKVPSANPIATNQEDHVVAERQIASCVAKFEPEIASLIRSCRAELRRVLPAAIELVYDNYNFFVIGYASTERVSDCIVSIAAAANGVGLSFYYGATLPDPHGILQGEGKQNRCVRIPTVQRLRQQDVKDLVLTAAARGKTPLPNAGKGYVVIKSVSAKQRPRKMVQ